MPKAPRNAPETPANYEFEQQNRLSIYWFDKSYNLKGAAAALWSTMHPPSPQSGRKRSPATFRAPSAGVALGPVYWMLCGMSIELLLKALEVARHQEPGKTHNLRQLAVKAGLRPDREKRGVLDLLSEAVIWYGRYPVPLEATRLEKFHNQVFEYLYRPTSRVGRFEVFRRNDALDWDSFDKLWNWVFEFYCRESRHFEK